MSFKVLSNPFHDFTLFGMFVLFMADLYPSGSCGHMPSSKEEMKPPLIPLLLLLESSVIQEKPLPATTLLILKN